MAEPKISKRQQAHVAKYNAAHYERINVVIDKGERAKIQAHAKAQGESTNAFIKRAITETMERDSQKENGNA